MKQPLKGKTVSETLASSATAQVAVADSLRLKVQGGDGREQMLVFSNLSEAEAVRRATLRGFRVLSVVQPRPVAAASTGGRSRVGFPLVLFSQELLALLDAGLNLTEALATLHAKERQAMVRAVLEAVLLQLREGRNFSDVLAMAPQHFPPVYVATVRASERTGDLPQALARYIAYQQQFELIRKKLISAAIYPVMLLVVGGLVLLFLLGYVVPKFSMVYESSGREMPWMSMLLLSFGKLIYNHWQLALLGMVGVFVSLGWGLSRPTGRAWLLGQVLRFPWLAGKADEFRLARFYRAVSLLLAAGISLPRAMSMVTGLLGAHQQMKLAQMRVAIEHGQSLSGALVGAGL
ncbi:MAG: type II secretion system F family protein, partial [Rhodocyclales bacterium]|nr:type II secretion system F family protein [Rhodocyclales bacterium]